METNERVRVRVNPNLHRSTCVTFHVVLVHKFFDTDDGAEAKDANARYSLIDFADAP